MDYQFGNTKLTQDSPRFTEALEQSWRTKERLTCGCSKTRPEMYVAKVAGHFVIKRMPDTGHLHHPDCGSYTPPAGISGLGQVLDSAITHSDEDDLTHLRLDFSLSQTGKRRPIPPAEEPATEAISVPRKLTLTGLLHYLWHDADLVKWYPAMEGKRGWWTIHSELTKAANGLVTKGNPLAERLYIPRPYKPEHRAEVDAERRSAFSRLTPVKGKPTQLGIVIAEYKSHEPARFGHKFKLGQIATPFFADQDLVDKFERACEDSLALAEMIHGSHLILIGTYSVSKTGVPTLNQIALMPVTRNWIPFENSGDAALLDHITEEKRPFVRPLRFNLPRSEHIASALLIDTDPPITCFIGEYLPEGASDEMAAWLWTGEGQLPPMPRDPEEEAYREMLESWQRKQSEG